MSLTVDGTWKAGVWATTVWADGVWREGTYVPPVVVVTAQKQEVGVRKRARVRRSDFSSNETYQLALRAALANAGLAYLERAEPQVTEEQPKSVQYRVSGDRTLTLADTAIPISAAELAKLQHARDMEEEELIMTFIRAIEEDY